MALRAKGQEVTISVVSGGERVESLTDIRNFEMEGQLEILREGYLGETTDRRDEVYRGVRGRFEIHFHSSDVFNFLRGIIDRARRRTPGVKVNITATVQFSDGGRARILVSDAKFGGQPLNFANRTEYGSIGVEFEAEDYTVIS